MIENIRFDKGKHPRGKIGFVVLAMEQTVEADVFATTPSGVGVHFTRIPMSNQVTAETLGAMEPDIFDAAKLLLPQGNLKVLCYTCNSGVMVIGEQKVMDILQKANSEARPTTVMTGVIRALNALEARRIMVVTPYVESVNVHVRRFLGERGFDIAALHSMGIEDNSDIDRMEPEFIREYVRGLYVSNVDAVALICGAMRAMDVVGALEKDLGLPVIASNQAMMWDCLRLCGVDDDFPAYGRIFSLKTTAHKKVC
jgi:maleate isomerase